MILERVKILFGIIFLGSVSVSGEVEAAGSMTVCELAAHPEKYLTHRVEVAGIIRGGLDRLLLIDASCPKRPISLSISNDVAAKQDVAPLWSAIYREGNIGTVGKHIRATVVGTYAYERGQWTGGVLSVEEVHDLKVAKNRGTGAPKNRGTGAPFPGS